MLSHIKAPAQGGNAGSGKPPGRNLANHPARFKLEPAVPDGRHCGGAPTGPATLESASNAMIAAAMAMQGADVTPTESQIAACTRARAMATDAMRRWTALKTTELGALNAKRRTAGQPAITPPGA